MIYYLGIEYAGLNNLFSSILQVLNLAELGVGAALTFSMYNPIAKRDTKKIKALMNLYRAVFRIIGTVILIIGIALIPFLPHLISGAVPKSINIYVLYLMYLMNSVLSYWLFAYKSSLLAAHQRLDISSKILLITNTIQYGVQLVVLIGLKDYYLFLAAAIFSQILTNLLTAYFVDQMYPEYLPSGKVDRDTLRNIKKQIQGLVTNKIGSTILNSSDSIVISAFLGLATLAKYQNYYFVFSSISALAMIFFQSMLAGIGNSIIVDSEKKTFGDFQTVTFIVMWLTSFCCAAFLLLFQPFITLWLGSKYTLDFSIVIMIVVYFFIYEVNQLIEMYKDAAGIWYVDRYRALLTALVNVCANIYLVQVMGLYGVLLSTVISLLFVGLPWILHNLFTYVFREQSVLLYTLKLFGYACTTFLICVITNYIGKFVVIKGYQGFVVRILICITVPNAINLIFFCRTRQFKKVLSYVTKRRN